VSKTLKDELEKLFRKRPVLRLVVSNPEPKPQEDESGKTPPPTG
jgi:hypothetical protein